MLIRLACDAYKAVVVMCCPLLFIGVGLCLVGEGDGEGALGWIVLCAFGRIEQAAHAILVYHWCKDIPLLSIVDFHIAIGLERSVGFTDNHLSCGYGSALTCSLGYSIGCDIGIARLYDRLFIQSP